MKFSLRFVEHKSKIVAESETGEVLASFKKLRQSTPRDASNSYDLHRIAKNDRFQINHQYFEEGRVDEVLAAVEAQLPQAFADAKWVLNKTVYPVVRFEFQMPEFRRHEFLAGVAGGCAWFGNTNKKTVANVKNAQKNLMFTL